MENDLLRAHRIFLGGKHSGEVGAVSECAPELHFGLAVLAVQQNVEIADFAVIMKYGRRVGVAVLRFSSGSFVEGDDVAVEYVRPDALGASCGLIFQGCGVFYLRSVFALHEAVFLDAGGNDHILVGFGCMCRKGVACQQ